MSIQLGFNFKASPVAELFDNMAIMAMHQSVLERNFCRDSQTVDSVTSLFYCHNFLAKVIFLPAIQYWGRLILHKPIFRCDSIASIEIALSLTHSLTQVNFLKLKLMNILHAESWSPEYPGSPGSHESSESPGSPRSP